MAKKASASDEAKKTEQLAKDKELLLAGLRKALDGKPKLQQGSAAKGGIFASGVVGEKLARKAIEAGYLVPSEPPAGVKATAAAKYARLTDQGRQFIREEDPLKRLLEEVLPIVKRLAVTLQDTADDLRNVLSVIPAGLLPREEVTLTSSEAGSGAPVPVAEAKAESRKPMEPAPEARLAPASLPAPALEKALHDGYEKLCLFAKFRDGTVEMPHLFREVRAALPGLTVEEFHRALLSLWKSNSVDLHTLNEVRTAEEPDKGIRHNDRFYYFVSWRNT